MDGNTPRMRVRRIVAAGVTALAVVVTPVVAFSSPAQAAPVVGFEAGNIISDSLFYDGGAMSTAQVQSFLNQRMPSGACKIGTPPYMPGALSPSGSGNRIASNCLRDFRMTTSTRAADAYCKAYAGASNESAAQIIAKVGAACGISQKVLLVMLEKEQSLVSDSWPVTRQYNFAMGMNCPDSGPNNSANCNSDSAGFFLQMYLGARQLKVYKGNPNSFNYKPFQTNRIQWHPNAGCGTSQVYIENWATAALYIYTPYRPNQAALNAGWGTGDGCSSYGNRNFYNFYKSWFGNTKGPSYTVNGAIATYWESRQGSAGFLGEPTENARTIGVNGGGRIQVFQGGVVYEPNEGVVNHVTADSPIRAALNASGGVAGPWGWPLAPATNQGSSGNNTKQFTNGLVVESTQTGVHLVPTVLVVHWQSTGGMDGSLGAPTDEAVSGAGNLEQSYQKNHIVRAASGSVVVIDSRFVEFWKSSGGVNNGFGLPTGAATANSGNGGGYVYKLANATLYRSAAGVFALPPGELATAYTAANGPQGAWGWPRGRQICAADASSCTMDFTRGVATWSELRGALFTPLDTPGAETPAPPGAGEKIVGGAA